MITLSQDAEYAKEQAEAELRAYEVQLNKVGQNNVTMKSSNRLFANHDDSINVVPGSNILDQSQHNYKSSVQKPTLQDSAVPSTTKLPDIPKVEISNPDHLQNKENISSRLTDFENAVRKIKDATGVSDANEIIQKFATHTETYKSLEHLKNKNERKILEL